MNYDRDYWKARLPLIQAFVEGKKVMYDGFPCLGTVSFIADPPGYTIVEPPKLVPWDFSEIPLNAWFRHRDLICQFPISGVDPATKRVLIQNEWWCSDGLSEWFIHSTDGGKTWKPCGKETV